MGTDDLSEVQLDDVASWDLADLLQLSWALEERVRQKSSVVRDVRHLYSHRGNRVVGGEGAVQVAFDPEVRAEAVGLVGESERLWEAEGELVAVLQERVGGNVPHHGELDSVLGARPLVADRPWLADTRHLNR